MERVPHVSRHSRTIAACVPAALAFLVSWASPLTAQAPEHPTGLDTLRRAYLAAYNAGDAAAMQALYVERAVRMPYDAPAQRGRRAIVAYYRNAFASRRLDPTLTFAIDRVLVRGDVAVERGSYREELRPTTGGPPLVEIGKYVAVARKGDDGRWRYETSIFNRDAAPRSTTPASVRAPAR